MTHYMIRITVESFDSLDQAIKNLELLGVRVDGDFPPIALDMEDKWFLVRASIPAALARDLDDEPGIELFPDPSIGPA